MIDKIFPRKLSSSTDARIQGKEDMLDALNITVNDMFDGVEGTNTGDAGVIKPAKGNEQTVAFPSTFTDEFVRRVIGSVSDTRNNIVYFFLFSQNADEQGVYCIDQFGRLFPSKDDQGNFFFNRVYSTSEFSFKSEAHVKGNVIHTSENQEGILYFTDNSNEPRKLNIKRCVQGDFPIDNTPDILDFITACPKTPIPAPIATFRYDGSKPSNDFANIEGYQFAYQCIYKDGEESAISTYSTLEYPPSYATQGKLKSPQLLFYNQCEIVVRKFLNDVPAWTSEISKIRLLGRIGNLGDFKAIDEKEVDGDNDVVFQFYNDEVITAIPKEDELKQFDNLPRVAKAQSVVGNRLMYGNYVEGYDDIGDVSETTTIQAVYNPFVGGVVQDIEIDVVPFMAPVGPADILFPTPINLVPPSTIQTLIDKRPAYLLDFSSLPESVNANSTITVSITVRPDRRYDVYNATNSFHTSSDMGLENFSTAIQSNIFTKKTAQGNPHHFQNNAGLSDSVAGDSVSWTTIYDVPNTNTSYANEEADVAYGTSPSNALSIPAENDFTFSVTLRYLEELNGDDVVNFSATAFSAAFSGNPIPADIPISIFETPGGFDITETSSWDHGLSEDGSTYIGIDDGRFEFINTLVRRQAVATAGVSQPCGFFILNKGSVSFRLNQRDDLPTEFGKIVLELNISNVDVNESDIHTCVPKLGFNYNFFTNDDSGSIGLNSQNIGFHAYSPSLIENGNFDPFLASINPDGSSVFTPLSFNSSDVYYKLNECIPLPPNDYLSAQQDLEYVDLGVDAGPISFFGTTLSFQDNSLLGSSLDRLRNIGVLKLNGRPLIESSRFYSICDGEVNASKGGDGTLSSVNLFYEGSGSDEGDVVFTNETSGPFDYRNLSFVFGVVYGCDFFCRSLSQFVANERDYPLVIGSGNFGFNEGNFNLLNDIDQEDVVNERAYPEVELKGSPVVNYNPGEELSRYSSFKTNANHDFGIVYYDERGRAGFVNKLGKVYVEGYSNQERGSSGLQGPVSIRIVIDHDPPPWAHHYQIVYAKNSTVSDFTFYSTGTAYVPQNQLQSNDGVIYVSLNYLQQNSDVSYAEVFGGVAKDGTKDFYKFKEGDRLRVHSYFDDVDANTRVYPKDIEFEVLGVELLTDDTTNPIAEDPNDVHEVYKGLYLKLKDNPSQDANGFNFESVQENQLLQGDDEYDSLSGPYGNRWRKNCIIEIFSPSRKQDAEERVFYETSRVFNVVTDPDTLQLVHEDTEIILTDGDVYFRKMAVNFNGAEGPEGEQYGLIEQEGTTVLTTPNFVNVFLENETFTDMFSGTNVYSFGKIKTIAPNAKEIRRDSSIKYSDKNSQSSSLLRYTSFNDAKFPFKDLPNENGSIQVILDYEDSVFCIQDDKTSAIPVERSILADVAGNENLIGSTEVLGTQRFFAGEYGTDHPESVVLADNNIYFASETNYEVYRFNPSNGLSVISDRNMKSFFKQLFTSVREQVENSDILTSVRVVGGYDPESEEYLITVKPIQRFVPVAPVTDEDTEDEVDEDIVVPDDAEDDGSGDDGGIDAPDDDDTKRDDTEKDDNEKDDTEKNNRPSIESIIQR